MDKRPLSTCTVKDLLSHIHKVGALDAHSDRDKWYVVINEHGMTIDLIQPETLEIHSIKAAQIYYGR